VNREKIIAVVGPTASGKTALGIFLAQKLNGEIISADSRQVYKGLDIGTGKVTKKEMAGIPHHLLDIASPKKQFTVDDFTQKGKKALEQIFQNKKTPIIVGGTGFYVDALLGRLTYSNVPPNPKLRAQLAKKSAQELFKLLKKLDPERAKNIDPQNPRRLIRAIEVAKGIIREPAADPLTSTGSATGSAAGLGAPTKLVAEPVDAETLSGLPRDAESLPEVLYLGINPSDTKLRKNIQLRLKSRLKQGMIAEAKKLHTQGVSYKRMEELGLEYRHLARFLQGRLNRLAFETELEHAIWHYARRQRTWFRRNKEIQWVTSKTKALALAKKFLRE
jgi:tRNA dimethylallyltransferase